MVGPKFLLRLRSIPQLHILSTRQTRPFKMGPSANPTTLNPLLHHRSLPLHRHK